MFCAWQLDAPAWGAAAKAMSTVAAEAAQFQALTEECDKGDNVACDTLSKEDEAKKAWLAKLDVPAWGKAAEAMQAMAVVDEAAVVSNTREEEAKRAWLAKLDVPSWGKISEEEAKKRWLAKLDAPVWGQAAAAMALIVAEANKVADLTAESNAGDSAATDALAKENEAKKAWLARLDVPSWGKMSEESAKTKWLAKLDEVPSWVGKVTPTAVAGPVFVSLEVSEEDAKKAWLAKLDVPSWQVA